MRPVTVFAAPGGNAFMTDIARWIVEAARETGRDARLALAGLPTPDGSLNLVVAPHELFTLTDAPDDEIRRAIAASVPVCTEQPGTPWFNLTCELVQHAPAVLDINRHGVDGLTARGIPARHLRLGGVPSMAHGRAERDVEVLFLGGSTPRRGAVLAGLAPVLWDRNVDLRLFRFSRPVDGEVPGVVFGDDKYELLGRSRILLNVHRDEVRPGYFEWARMVEAMANGCCVVTEPSAGFDPLVEGEHFVATDDLAGALRDLLDDPDRCAAIGAAGRAAVLERFPLVASLAPLLAELDGLDPAGSATGAGGARRPLPRGHRPPLLPEFRPAEPMRERVYRALLDEMRLSREIERVRCEVLHGADDVVLETETPAFADAQPEVSVIVTLYGYADVVRETLDSIVASRDVELEIVVVDDHSRDHGRDVVRAFMDEHPHVPMLLLGSEVNRGLPASRNLGVARSRAGLVMMMDADNMVYPNCIRVLADALASDPGAAFAYATLEAFGAQPGLRSELAWYPAWLCETNYIDAQAMVRRTTYERHGGYRDDELVYGWEDWELWLRLAEAGERGLHVPRMLGRYRTQASSMISITNLVAARMRADVRSLHPGLPWPEGSAAVGGLDPEVAALRDELASVHVALGRARRRQELRQSPLAALGDVADRLAIPAGVRRRLGGGRR